MEKLTTSKTVGEILEAKRGVDSYVDYVCKAYGNFTIPVLLSKIESSKPIGCFNRHERDGFHYTECPMNQVDEDGGMINNLCSHQSDYLEIKCGSSRVLHKHAIGLYRAGLYILEEHGISLTTDVSHDALERLVMNTSIIDYPCETEYSRFTGRTPPGQYFLPLEQRNDRDPVLRKATSLPLLQEAVNEMKIKCAEPMNSMRDTIAAALRQLLYEIVSPNSPYAKGSSKPSKSLH